MIISILETWILINYIVDRIHLISTKFMSDRQSYYFTNNMQHLILSCISWLHLHVSITDMSNFM